MPKVRRGGKVVYVNKSQYQNIKQYKQVAQNSGISWTLGQAMNNMTPQQTVQPQQTQQAVQLNPTDVANGNVQAGSVSYDQFVTMTADQKADVIMQTLSEQTPNFLEDSPLQRFAYSTGMSTKPTMVDDATLDSMKGKELFRTVISTYDKKSDVGYSAKEICDQLQYGDFTMYNANGAKAYGAGLYFATDYGHSSRCYGGSKSNTLTMRAKISSNAKVITLSKASSNAQKEMNSGSKLGNALRQVQQNDRGSVASMWAIANGYDVLDCQTSNGYHTVLNRGALVMSTTTKSPQSNGRWK